MPTRRRRRRGGEHRPPRKAEDVCQEIGPEDGGCPKKEEEEEEAAADNRSRAFGNPAPAGDMIADKIPDGRECEGSGDEEEASKPSGGRRRRARGARRGGAGAAPPESRRPQQPPRGDRVHPTEAEVVGAINSMYFDELKPVGRLLRKRVAERALPEGEESDYSEAFDRRLPDVDVDELKELCQACSQLELKAEDGGDWSVKFSRDEAEPAYVCENDPDVLSEQVWDGAAAYFEALSDEDMHLPGGRYLCARVLKARNLDFLAGLSLGRMSNFIQISIQHRKLLGYLNGNVVPYGRSQSMAKDNCARFGQPCSRNSATPSASRSDCSTPIAGSSLPEIPLATWASAKQCLQDMLSKTEPGIDGERSIPLSNVKRRMLSEYKMQLQETVLGCSKLSDLLNAPFFREVCELRLEGSGYKVVQAEPPSVKPGKIIREALRALRPVPAPLMLTEDDGEAEEEEEEEGSGAPAATRAARAPSTSATSAISPLSVASMVHAYGPPLKEGLDYDGAEQKLELSAKFDVSDVETQDPGGLISSPYSGRDFISTPDSYAVLQGRGQALCSVMDFEELFCSPSPERVAAVTAVQACKIRNTFVDFPPTPQADVRRARSVPKDFDRSMNNNAPGGSPSSVARIGKSVFKRGRGESGQTPSVGQSPTSSYRGITTPTPWGSIAPSTANTPKGPAVFSAAAKALSEELHKNFCGLPAPRITLRLDAML